MNFHIEKNGNKYYYTDSRFEIAKSILDELVNVFQDDARFKALVKKNKHLSAWIISKNKYELEKEKKKKALERAKVREMKRNEKIQKILSKLTDEEKEALGFNKVKKK
jgi:predicted RNA-binding protein YlxR (DUF448 family)